MSHDPSKTWVTANFSKYLSKRQVLLVIPKCAMTHYELPWPTMSHYDPLWPTMSYYEPLWVTMSYYDPLWATMIHYDQLWVTMSHFDPLCATMSYYYPPTFSTRQQSVKRKNDDISLNIGFSFLVLMFYEEEWACLTRWDCFKKYCHLSFFVIILSFLVKSESASILKFGTMIN